MRFLASIIAVALVGCAQASFYRSPSAAESRTLIWEEDLTLEEQTYLMVLRGEATAFEIPVADADAAWARAGDFVRTHSAMGIRQSDAAVIRTEARVAPAGFVPKTCDAGYLISRERKGDVYAFTVRTSVAAPDWVPCELGRRRNARMLARFIRTGELPHPHLLQR